MSREGEECKDGGCEEAQIHLFLCALTELKKGGEIIISPISQ